MHADYDDGGGRTGGDDDGGGMERPSFRRNDATAGEARTMGRYDPKDRHRLTKENTTAARGGGKSSDGRGGDGGDDDDNAPSPHGRRKLCAV